jgi:hypothetical protein
MIQSWQFMAPSCLDGERLARQLSGVKQPHVRRAGAAVDDPSATWGDPNLLRYTTAVPSAFLFAVGA